MGELEGPRSTPTGGGPRITGFISPEGPMTLAARLPVLTLALIQRQEQLPRSREQSLLCLGVMVNSTYLAKCASNQVFPFPLPIGLGQPQLGLGLRSAGGLKVRLGNNSGRAREQERVCVHTYTYIDREMSLRCLKIV